MGERQGAVDPRVGEGTGRPTAVAQERREPVDSRRASAVSPERHAVDAEAPERQYAGEPQRQAVAAAERPEVMVPDSGTITGEIPSPRAEAEAEPQARPEPKPEAPARPATHRRKASVLNGLDGLIGRAQRLLRR
ncbi:hypothetical protein MUY14_19140 [Amycolatopsis sp. FBCC-B4732]|uniref:hypothetical protein n=1 Tax=Amycolatopsis sp. FBCC-B4732 TaxID=3079339 RepID=UPI001FF50E7C|nr:hypothetical protein [Amycolatopsis sp. FBCC-B4732]UOX92631.1 hypothetical protein MUY14_19140 [Amycolatopsis sp. FBCC-B4732]